MPFAFNQSPLTILPSTMVENAHLTENDVIILINDNEVLVSKCSPLWQVKDVDFIDDSPLLQLGQYKTQRIFIHNNQTATARTGLDNDWWDLRRMAVEMMSDLASISAQACAINHWHKYHQFCGKCGSNTLLGKEHSRVCINAACSEISYPRVDPAIIVAVVNENDEILLGRKANWDPSRYSVLAGFVSHGESLENCVAREVKEETGVNIHSLEYINSQSWPFPGSIMIGFHATAKNEDIAPADDELEDVIWIGRQTLREKVENKEIKLPNRYSISRYLVERWLNLDA
jgi:NAD+ diphosphatase